MGDIIEMSLLAFKPMCAKSFDDLHNPDGTESVQPHWLRDMRK